MADEQDDADIEVVSTERFIEEVRIQPAIWDLSSSEYGNRMEKVKAWEKICFNVIPNFSNFNSNEKYKKVIQLQKRWKGLRSCFNREKKKKNEKSGTSATARKEYQYFSQLSFLASMGDMRPKTNPTENIPQKSPMVDISKSQECEEIYENDILRKNSEDIGKKQEVVNDHDLNFLHSLLPHFKKVSDEFKLDLQSEILYTLKKYVNYSRANNNLNQYSQPFEYKFSISPTTSTHQNTATSPTDTYNSQDSNH